MPDSLNLCGLIEIALDRWVVDASSATEAPNRTIAAGRVRRLLSIPADANPVERSLDLSNLQLTRVPPLPPHLDTLGLERNQLVSLDGMLLAMPYLRQLRLDGNRLVDIEQLPMAPLEDLHLADNCLDGSLAPIGQYWQTLRTLDLSGNPLLELTGLPRAMSTLTQLILNTVPLTTLRGLPAEMPALERLEASGGVYSSLDGLPEALPQLRRLCVQEGRLSSLSGMPATLPKLQRLQLLSNYLTSLSLEGLPPDMPALVELELRHNRLPSRSGLPLSLLARERLSIDLESHARDHAMIDAITARHATAFIRFDAAERDRPIDHPLLGGPRRETRFERYENIAARRPCNVSTRESDHDRQRNVSLLADAVRISLQPHDVRPRSTIPLLNVNGIEMPTQLGPFTVPLVLETRPPLRNFGTSVSLFSAIQNLEQRARQQRESERSLPDRLKALGVTLSDDQARACKAWETVADYGSVVAFLNRLPGCRVFNQEVDPGIRQAAARDLGEIVSHAIGHPGFRQYMMQSCGGAETDCTDNVQEVFNMLRVAAMDPGQREQATVHEVLAHHRKAFRLHLLDRYVAAEFSSGDKLEEALALKILLQEALELPVKYDGMNHASVTAVMRHPAMHMRQAEAYVRMWEAIPGAFEAYLQSDPFWQAFVSRQCVPAIDAHNALWAAAQETLEQKGAPLPGEDRNSPRVQAARASTWAAALESAHTMPGLGTGREFQALQEAARAHLMRELGEGLMKDPARGGGARVAYRWLSANVQWQAFQTELARTEHRDMDSASPGKRIRHEVAQLTDRTPTPQAPSVFLGVGGR